MSKKGVLFSRQKRGSDKNKNKKILHIISNLDLGGAETALFRLLSNMSDHYQFTVIVLKTPGYYSKKIKNLGIPIHFLHMNKTNFFYQSLKLLFLIKKIKPEIVQTWLYHADLLGGLAAKLCGIKQIIWGVRCEGQGLKRSTRWIKKLCAFSSSFLPSEIIINSKVAAENHIIEGYCAKKVTVIPNGFDSTHFSPTTTPHHPAAFPQEPDWIPRTNRRTTGRGGKEFAHVTIGTLARYHPDKDYPTLILAIDAVCEIHTNVHFILCGFGCSDTNHELTTMLSSIKHKNKIILINGVEDTPAYLNNLDIFVLNSKTESFPNSLAEAMLCGLPCITTEVGEVRDILGNTGLIIPPENPKKLAEACMQMLIKSQGERKQLGILARERIKQRYSFTKNIEMMTKIYED